MSTVQLAEASSGNPAGAGRPTPTPPSRPSWRSRISMADVKYSPYLFISPFFLLFAIFGLFPLVATVVVSLRTWRLDDPSSNDWAGLANFRRVFSDGDFLHALRVTFGIFFVATIPQLLIALGVAALLNRKLRFATGLRMGMLLPYVTSIAASTLVFGSIFARDTGLANYLLSLVHLGPVDWHASTPGSWIAIATIVDWRWIGYNALIYLAAMQAVPREVYEASSIDGAGQWRQFTRITIPMIKPAIVFTAVLSTIGGLQLFTEPLLFDSDPNSAMGGSVHQFRTVAMLIYRTGWQELNLGYAAAMAWVMFIIVVLVAAFNGLLTNRLGGDR